MRSQQKVFKIKIEGGIIGIYVWIVRNINFSKMDVKNGKSQE